MFASDASEFLRGGDSGSDGGPNRAFGGMAGAGVGES